MNAASTNCGKAPLINFDWLVENLVQAFEWSTSQIMQNYRKDEMGFAWDLKNRTKHYLKKSGGFQSAKMPQLAATKAHIQHRIKIRVKVQTHDTLNKTTMVTCSTDNAIKF